MALATIMESMAAIYLRDHMESLPTGIRNMAKAIDDISLAKLSVLYWQCRKLSIDLASSIERTAAPLQ